MSSPREQQKGVVKKNLTGKVAIGKSDLVETLRKKHYHIFIFTDGLIQ